MKFEQKYFRKQIETSKYSFCHISYTYIGSQAFRLIFIDQLSNQTLISNLVKNGGGTLFGKSHFKVVFCCAWYE